MYVLINIHTHLYSIYSIMAEQLKESYYTQVNIQRLFLECSHMGIFFIKKQ